MSHLQQFSSLPVRGAWIEIKRTRPGKRRWRSLPVRGAWIEIFLHKYHNNHKASLPVRGAWIEIHVMILLRLCAIVAPCEGSVDWNSGTKSHIISVTSRSLWGERGLKSVKSLFWHKPGKSLPVRGAWIETGIPATLVKMLTTSLPVRGAWIEIYAWHRATGEWRVAPCEGSVDWNERMCYRDDIERMSLPVRGAWIEMSTCTSKFPSHARRSLWGERGLKFDRIYTKKKHLCVAPCEGSVDWNWKKQPRSPIFWVAPCEGSVDWSSQMADVVARSGSLAARKVWIGRLISAWRQAWEWSYSQRGECGLKYR